MKKLLWIPLLVLTAGIFWFLGSSQGRKAAISEAPTLSAVQAPSATAPTAAGAAAPAAPLPPGLPPPAMPPGLAQQFLESRARNRDMMMQPFDMLLQDLGFEPGARASAMAALKEHDELVAAQMAASLPPNGKPPTIAELQAQDRARDAKLRSALGEEGFAQYQANVDTIPERLALATLENRLSQAGAPLSDQQADQVLTAMVQAARNGTTPLPSTAPDPGQNLPTIVTKDPTQRFEDVSAALTQTATNLSPNQQALISQFITQTKELRSNLPGRRP